MTHYAVMHIGKTAGTALRAVLEAHKAGNPDAAIEIFRHEITFGDLCRIRPYSRIVFFVRDPIDRFVSGFNSRLRMGRPRYDNPWSQEEAVAFSVFGSPNALAEALSPEHEFWDVAREAMRSIYHLRLGLGHYLHSASLLETQKERIAFIGATESFEEDLLRLKRLLRVDPDIEPPRDAVGAHRNPSSLSNRLSQAAERNLRSWYSADYEIYAWCLQRRQALFSSVP